MTFTKKIVIFLLVMLVAVPFLIWLMMPMFTFLTLDNVKGARQSVRSFGTSLFFVRMLVYCFMVFFMPVFAGLPKDRLGDARKAIALLLLAVELVLVQRLWLF